MCTIAASSEEVASLYCEPCSSENQRVDAEGYCEDCREYLCATCFNCHRKQSATKRHTLAPRHDMPKTKPPPLHMNDLVEKCPRHAEKVIEYVCNNHEELCCAACLNTVHKTCSNTSYIPDISDDESSETYFKCLRKELEDFRAHITDTTNVIKRKIQQDNEEHEKIVQDVHEIRQELETFLDKAEEGTIKKVEEVNVANCEQYQKAIAKLDNVLTDLVSTTSALDNKKGQGNKSQLFVEMKQATKWLSQIKADALDGKRFKVYSYEIAKDKWLKDMKSEISSLFSVSVVRGTNITKARFLKDICVKTEEDNVDCAVPGMVALSANRLVVADYENCVIKMINTETDHVICRLPTTSKPSDVTSIGVGEVAVAMPREKKIDVIKVTNGLSRVRSIDVGSKCISVACSKDNMFAACQKPAVIKVIDKSGVILKTFQRDGDGNELFKTPRCIGMSEDHNIIFVTDLKANTLTKMSTDGRVLSVYKDGDFKGPVATTV